MVESVSLESLDHLRSWHAPWDTLHALVVGLGATGFAVADTLRELGARVTIVARDAEDDVTNIATVIGAEIVVSAKAQEIEDAVTTSGADVAIVSPGVSQDDPAIQAVRDAGIPLWSDVDFAWRVRDKYENAPDWIVVAGERHGATIVELASRILLADGRIVGVAGYQHPPVLDLIRDPVGYRQLIVHASADSLAWWEHHPQSLREPLISVCVDEDIASDAGVLYDGTRLACVYWRGTGVSESLVEAADVVEGARAIGVGVGSPGMSEVGLVEGIVCDRAFLDDRKNQALEISTIEELQEAGWDLPAQLPAVFAAIAIARALDVSPALIAGVVSLP
jgi:UDP-N-acetylmuramoylalanine--D-glutamate ligase